MKKNLIATLFTLAFALSATTLVVAADMAKSEEPAAAMYSAKCKAPCSFSVKSHDKQEVAAILKEHAKSHHNGMVMSDADCDGMIKTVEAKK
jgi:predicted small metal-binding protein